MMWKGKGVKGSSDAVLLSNGDSEKNLKLKEKLSYGGGSGSGGGGRSVGVMMEDVDELLSSWPPRHYTCSFCRRRFKSAQALGGHMNVHRRARAMLRTQSISPIPSPPSSPWLPSTITTSHAHQHPLQDEKRHCFIYPSPNPHNPTNIPHLITNPSHSNLPHLPMIGIAPSWSLTNFKLNFPLSSEEACKHVPEARYRHTELNNGEKAKKYCIRAEHKLHQDDAFVRLSLGDANLITSRPPVEEGIDLELRLGSLINN